MSDVVISVENLSKQSISLLLFNRIEQTFMDTV